MNIETEETSIRRLTHRLGMAILRHADFESALRNAMQNDEPLRLVSELRAMLPAQMSLNESLDGLIKGWSGDITRMIHAYVERNENKDISHASDEHTGTPHPASGEARED
jgi:hypothetical protein